MPIKSSNKNKATNIIKTVTKKFVCSFFVFLSNKKFDISFNFQLTKLFSVLVVITLLFTTSCKDQGCIDADDFGDYDSTSIRVNAKSKNYDCSFGTDSSLSGSFNPDNVSEVLKDKNYSIDLKACVESDGCEGKTILDEKVECVKSCIASCQNNELLGNFSQLSNTASPAWVLVGNKGTVKLTRDTEIYVTASGQINLGSSEVNNGKILINDDLIKNPGLTTVGEYEKSNTSTISRSGQSSQIISDIVFSYLKCSKGSEYYHSPSINSLIQNKCNGQTDCSIDIDNFQDYFQPNYASTAISNFNQLYCKKPAGYSISDTATQSFYTAYNRGRKSLYYVEKNQDFAINFSGDWSDGTNNNLLKSNNTAEIDSYKFKDYANVINGTKRLLLYVQKVPYEYMQDEYFPAAPNPLTWNCKLTGEAETREMNCSGNLDKAKYKTNDSYLLLRTRKLTTTNPNETLISSTENDPSKPSDIANYNKKLSDIFNIDNSSDGSSLNYDNDYGTYGFVRYLNDGLKPDNFDVSADSYSSYHDNFRILSSLTLTSGRYYLGNPRNNPSALKISFKSTSSTANYNCSIQYNIENAEGNDLLSANSTVSFDKGITSWSTSEITLEPSEVLSISTTSCDNNTLVIRTLRYRDIKIAKSGFIRFALLDDNDSIYDTDSGGLKNDPSSSFSDVAGNKLGRNGLGCRIKARIINEQEKYIKTPQSLSYQINDDYFEYDKSNDPLFSDTNQVYVYLTKRFLPSIPSEFYSETQTSISTASVGSRNKIFWDKYSSTLSSQSALTQKSLVPELKLTNPVFVRKGQKIRFDPISWNGNVLSSYDFGRKTYYNKTECGKGLVVITEPRPAVLCLPNLINDELKNRECRTITKTDGTLGCDAYSSKCDIVGDSYCSSNCRAQATDISKCITESSSSCTDDLFKCEYCLSGQDSSNKKCYSNGVETLQSCKKCVVAMNAGTSQPVMIERAGGKIYNQCFDLENYTGSVKSLFTLGSQITDYSTLKSKLETKLSQKISLLQQFNGYYGNVSNFSSTQKIDSETGSVVFQTKNLTSDSSGILKMMLVDGSSFTEIASNNYSSVNPYLNNSGKVKVAISSSLYKFSNGQRMEMVLCNDSNENSVTCNSAIASQFLNPNGVIYLDGNKSSNPSFSSSSQISGGNYYFDETIGELKRYTNKSDGNNFECKITSNQSNFYCYSGDSGIANENNARLAFKISDPETLNCHVPPSSSADPTITKSCKISDSDTSTVPKCNAVIQANPNYDSSETTNNNAICSKSELGQGKTCKKQFICNNPYLNNIGFYDVSIRVKKPAITSISGIINSIIEPVLDILDTRVKIDDKSGSSSLYSFNPLIDNSKDGKPDSSAEIRRPGLAAYLYKQIISDPSFKFIVNMTITLMLMFYGLGYFMGVSELKQTEIVNRLIKIGVIYLFTSPSGYEWFQEFFVQFFKDGIEYLTFAMASAFDDSPGLQNAIQNKNYLDKTPLFYSVDKVLSLMLNETIHKKILSLLFYNFFGFIYLLVIYWAAIQYMYAIGNAILLYLTSQFFTSLLFGIAPIFFVFLLFNQTKTYFDNWLNSLLGFGLQRIFLIFTLSIFNLIIYELIKLTLNYRVCWGEVWSINMGISHLSLLSMWQPHSSPPYLNQALSGTNSASLSSSTPNLAMILSLWAVCCLMLKFISYITSLASSLSDGISASDLGSDISKAMASGISSVNSEVNKLWEKSGASAVVDRMDNALFKSGKIAKEERGRKRLENKKDMVLRNELSKAGDEAIKDYKKDPNNLSDLSKMNEEERSKKFKEIRNEAIIEKGKKLGLSEKKIDKLRNQKGINYVGDNIFGLGFAALKQSNSSGGALFKNIDQKNDQKNDSSLSMRQFESAMKKASPEQREEILKAVNEGKFDFKMTNRDKFNELMKNKGGLPNPLKDPLKFVRRTPISIARLADRALGAVGIAADELIGKRIRKAANGVGNIKEENKIYSDAVNELQNKGEIRRMDGFLGKLGRRNNSPQAKDERRKIRELVNEKRIKAREENRKAPNEFDKLRINKKAEYLDKKDDIKKGLIDNNGGLFPKGNLFRAEGAKEINKARNDMMNDLRQRAPIRDGGLNVKGPFERGLDMANRGAAMLIKRINPDNKNSS